MMTLYNFNVLNGLEKSEALFTYATFIDDRNEEKFKVQHYRLNNFYVEVYYNYLKNQIERFISFSSTDQLEPYLNKISLAGLV